MARLFRPIVPGVLAVTRRSALAPMHSRSRSFGVAITGDPSRDHGLHDEMREPHEQEARSSSSAASLVAHPGNALQMAESINRNWI